ncbi:hypothetical protein KF728_01990 [Candidatus Obscuribacterales bacterium]|nr:hypothetical protein [Candidatus Obscuribacterales bacterium]MBX3148899.1 hypothetical protein [Candidatus Obscuribacterales bacterium]
MSKSKDYKDVSDEVVDTYDADVNLKNGDAKEDDKIDTSEYTDAGDIGDEQLPAGEIKTDKKVWDYDASKAKVADLPKKVKDFVAGL